MEHRLVITLECGGHSISWVSEATKSVDLETISAVLAAEIIDTLMKKPELVECEVVDKESWVVRDTNS